MNIFKKILSLSMVFLLVFSCIPLSAFAEEATTEVIAESMSEETASEDSPVSETPPLETVMNPAEESGEEPVSETVPAEESSPESIPEEPTEESIIPEDNVLDETVDENSLEDIPPETMEMTPETENAEELPAEEQVTEEQPSDNLPVEEVSENEPETAEDPDKKTIEELIEGEPSEESVDEKPIPCSLTVELMDVRDSIIVRRNEETVASVFGNYAPGSGSYFLVCPNRLEPLAVDADGATRLTFEAMTGDSISVDVGEPGYASVDFKSAEELNTTHSNGLSICSLIMTGDTVITINGDYSAADGYSL